MAAGIPARLSRADARRFGLVVGAAFGLLGALVWWRGHPLVASGLAGLGAALIAGGIVRPTALAPIYQAWMGLALVISRFTTPLLLGAVYFLAITPIGLVRRVAGQNPMRARAAGNSFWVDREPRARPRTDMERQF
ncbi:MAG TPA: SxtJ family membrane protein [Gemmatimonadales bacterium]